MPKILAIAGSIRRDSWNRKLIRVAVEATRAADGNVTLLDLADYPLPLYDGDPRSTTPVDRESRVQQFDSATAEEHPRLGIARMAGRVRAGPLPEQGRRAPRRIARNLRRDAHAAASAAGAQHAGALVLPGQFSLAHADTAFDVEGGTLMLKSPARLHALVLELVSTTAALKRA